jgi:hypothetical protein
VGSSSCSIIDLEKASNGTFVPAEFLVDSRFSMLESAWKR